MVIKLVEILSFIDRNFLNNGDTFNDCLFPTLNSRVSAVTVSLCRLKIGNTTFLRTVRMANYRREIYPHLSSIDQPCLQKKV